MKNENNTILSFEDFINEGVALATNGGSFGSGNITASSPGGEGLTGSANNYSGNGNPTSTGTIGNTPATSFSTSTKQSAKPIKKVKKRKFQLEPKNVRMSGTNTPKESMYVTKWSDWSDAK